MEDFPLVGGGGSRHSLQWETYLQAVSDRGPSLRRASKGESADVYYGLG